MDINDTEEKGVKNNFRVSSLSANGDIEKKCPWRGRKRQLKLLDFIWQQGPQVGVSTHHTEQNQEKDEAQGIIYPRQIMLGSKCY